MPVFWRNTKKGQTKELTKIYYLRAILINKYLRQNLDSSENLRSNQCKVGTLGHISISWYFEFLGSLRNVLKFKSIYFKHVLLHFSNTVSRFWHLNE